ncbi:MAG: methylenetetrahydrofolate reductase [NAD(P)H] [Candidatus Omnitrophica bacterium]|nr:methylenetetrahydrofolate reductase [NAD(P)H] [Candidatus Omnitrophota bacterium]
MQKITDIFKNKAKTFSFEIFPPKTDKGMESLRATLTDLAALHPDFISVTYGAGGSSRDKTLGIVRLVQETHKIPTMQHFTCVLHSKAEIKGILDELKRLDIRSLLALRGDPPRENPDWAPGSENFKYSSELVAFIRQHYGDFFAIGVAGFPEGHPMAFDRAFDAAILQKKISAGGEFVMTQLFFDNQLYFDYVKRLRGLGVNVRVIPGVLPITNYDSAVKFCQGCGASVPQKVHDIFAPIAEDKEATLQAGIIFAIEQCRELLAGGAPGIHLYTLNKAEPARTILQALS